MDNRSYIECTDAEGFEDQLSKDGLYKPMQYKGNSVQVMDNNGNTKWYGKQRFDLQPFGV